MTTPSITSSITEGQKKQYLRFVEDAAERALGEVGLDKEGIQKLIERGDEFQSRIIAGIWELSVSNQFADEEVRSSYRYPSDYKPKGITEQMNRLRELFPGIGYADLKLAEATLSPPAEGWFAIPRWEKVATTYHEACLKMLALVSKTRQGKFHNYREDEIDPQHLRQHKRSIAMWKKVGDTQKDHDILVIPAQFGLRHRGRSIRRAREVFNDLEFGLGTFAIGIMLLTHPERLMNHDDLWIDCVGDEFSLGADGWFARAPYFFFHDGEVGFDTNWLDDAHCLYGSASAFLPQ